MSNLEMPRIIDVRKIMKKGITVDIIASPEERQLIAKRLGIRAVHLLTGQVALSGDRLIQVTGRFQADVIQACVVTLDDVPEHVSGDFDLLFSENRAQVNANELLDIDMDADDIEPIENGKIDVGELVIEYLSLSLDRFPRKSQDVSFSYEEETDEEDIPPHPFAKLAELKKKI